MIKYLLELLDLWGRGQLDICPELRGLLYSLQTNVGSLLTGVGRLNEQVDYLLAEDSCRQQQQQEEQQYASNMDSINRQISGLQIQFDLLRAEMTGLNADLRAMVRIVFVVSVIMNHENVENN